MTKSLLLKGLAGVAAVGGVVGGGYAFQEQIKGVFSSSSSSAGAAKPVAEVKKDKKSNLTHKELIDKAGLSCGLAEDVTELKDNETKECSVKEGGSITVKVGSQTEEGVSYSSETSKLKVSKREGYSNNLKFVVDSGDLPLTKKEGGEATTIQKLEQFETYEITEEGGKFYLTRKTEAKEGKKDALGLGECTLPASGDTAEKPCSYNTEEKIKKIRFEGHEAGIDVSNGTVTLKVSIKDSTDFGEDKYRFTFTFPSDVTINNKNLKANTPYDFKIKKQNNSNNLTLEQAWESDNAFTKKAGLDCTNGSTNGCTVSSTDPKLNVKVGNQKKEGITNITGSGKIKMETEQAGYNQGLKFTITTADVTLSGGTHSGTDITKLEELETYEITEEGGKYYLTRKDEASKTIESQLGLPSSCNLSSTSPCSITSQDLQKINFYDKDSTGASMSTGTATLTISKTDNKTDFPLGYKFTLQSEQEITIKSSTNTVKAKIPTDFKIKREDGKPVSLEKAWSDTNYSLAAKVGLECTDSSGCCTKTGTTKLNVKKGTDVKTDIETVTTTSGKIKVEKDKEGYNQGLKFTITTGDVTLTGGNKVSGSTDIQKLEELETYEITEESGKYYLTRKDEASKTIGDLLGLTDAGCNISTSTSCTLDTDKIKKVKFDGKDTTGPTMASGTATITISKASDTTKFPLGYKFALQSQKEITIKNSQGNTNKVAANTPYDFKIKKNDSNPTSLTLEKAWDMNSLGAKVGLTCTNSGGTDICCSKTGSQEKLNVKKGDDTKTDITSVGTSGTSKIKVKKDQEGYNQGLKFTITGGDVTLNGGTKDGASSDVTKLEEFETYEIKEEGGKWYLTRKSEAIVFIKKQLGIDGFCNSGWGKSSGFTCDIKDPNNLKKVNFGGDNQNISWPTGDIAIQLVIENNSSGGGLKIELIGESGKPAWCIPDGKGGSINLNTQSSQKAEYQFKKCEKNGEVTLSLEKKNGGGSSSTCAK